MSEEKKPKLRPVFDNVEDSVKTWWKNLSKFVQVYLWGLLFSLIPLLIGGALIALLFWANLSGQIESNLLMVLAAIVGFIALLAYIYLAVRAYLAIFIMVKKDYAIKALEAYKESSPYCGSYIWLALLTTCLLLLWFLALIIPGIIFAVFYSLAVYVYIFEGKKGLEAIKRSKELVTGYWWAVFGRFLLLGLLVWIFMMIISVPLNTLEQNSLPWILWNALVQIISYLIGPVSLLFTYNIYQDLSKIKNDQNQNKQ